MEFNEFHEPQSMMDWAVALAATYHLNQVRAAPKIGKVGVPYLYHPLTVMKRLLVWGIADETVLAAAICHDLYEDTSVCEDEVIEVTNEQVHKIVEELSFLPHPEPKNSREKGRLKQEYLASFREKSLEALVIKVADRLDNTWDFLDEPEKAEYAAKYFQKAGDLIDAMYARRKTISDRYGLGVFDLMHKDVKKLQQALMEADFS